MFKKTIKDTNEKQEEILRMIEKTRSSFLKKINYVIPIYKSDFIMPISQDVKPDLKDREILIKQSFKKAIRKIYDVADSTTIYKERGYKAYEAYSDQIRYSQPSDKNYYNHVISSECSIYYKTTFDIFYKRALEIIKRYLNNAPQHGYSIELKKDCIVITTIYHNVDEYVDYLLRKYCRKKEFKYKLLGFITGTNYLDLNKKDMIISLTMEDLINENIKVCEK